MVCHVWIIVVRDADQDKESFLDPGNFDPTHLDPRLENSLNKYPHGANNICLLLVYNIQSNI